jgi:hypothetical protein
MRILGVAVVGAVCLIMTSCGSGKPQELIIGKWQSVEDPIGFEYTPDGNFKRADAKTRRYRFIDDRTIEITDPDGNHKDTYTVTVTRSERILAGRHGDVDTYKRVR